MAKYIRTLTIQTDAEIQQKEVPLFRGAVLNSLGERANILFHNHTQDNKFRYSYPLIQYKRLSGNAAVVCIEEAVDLIGQFLTETNNTLKIGERELEWHTSKIQPTRLLVQTWEESFHYHLSKWLPLNSKNYQIYKNIEGIVERIAFLENILKGNLLSMLKGLNIHLEQELLIKITEISDPYLLYYKGIKLMAFNVDFNSNLTIPDNIGIGKNASIGFGIIHHQKEKKDIIEIKENCEE